MKIALFHPWIKSRGGAEKVILELVKNSSFNIDIYTWYYDKKETYSEFENFRIISIAPRIFRRFSRSFLLRGFFSLLLALVTKIPLNKYDAFVISTSGLAELITLRNYKAGKTFAYVHTILRAASDEITWNLKYRIHNPLHQFFYLASVFFYKFLEKIAWKKLDTVIFNSSLTYQRAKKIGLLKNKKAYIIHPPVNLIRAKISSKGDYFLYLARFTPMKRQDILLSAWKQFVTENPKFKLVLAGSIEDKKYFEKILSSARKTKNVIIKTKVKNPTKLYSKAYAVIFIPYKEDFGLVPIEAALLNKLLILTDTGGFMDIIKNYPNKILISEKRLNKHTIFKALQKSVTFNEKKVDKKIFKKLASKEFVKEMEKIFYEN